MTYPDDVMKAARHALADLYIENGFSPTSGRVTEILSGERDEGEAIQAIARAIMAERQRAAAICRANARLHIPREQRSRHVEIEPGMSEADELYHIAQCDAIDDRRGEGFPS